MRKTVEDTAIMRAVLDRSPDMIAISEFSGRVRYINPAGLALVGLDDTETEDYRTTVEFFTAAGLETSHETESALKSQRQWRGDSELRHFQTGAAIPVAISAFVIDGAARQPSMIASIIHDRRPDALNDRLLHEAAEAASQSAAEHKAISELTRLALDGELPQLLQASTVAAATLTGVDKSLITSCTATDLDIEAITGITDRDDGIGMPIPADSLMGFAVLQNDTIVCTDRRTEDRFDTSLMAAYGLRSGVAVPIAGSDGLWGVLSVHAVDAHEYSDGEVAFLLSVAGILSTAIRRVELDRLLRDRSLHDALTGLANRELAYERIDAALARARREATAVAVLLLDIDDFKIVNDSLGHEAGDAALLRFAQRLRSTTRECDTVARLGGDEFVIVCEDVVDLAQAQTLAHDIIRAIAHPDPEGPSPLSASIGIAVSDQNSTRRELIHRADLAMYRAKEAGPGTHAVFDHADVYDAERIRALSIDLRLALANDELTLHYQPLVDIASGRVVAMEALARWEHPVHGNIGPTEFVAVAERTGLASALGRWSLSTACAEAAKWREFCDVMIRVNVSALQLRTASFVADVAEVLAATKLEPSELGLEITETVWVADTARVAVTLSELKRMGVMILLDDMGKGHSSISYLNRYPVFGCFKIDKEYIAALPGVRPQAIVSALVAIAKAFDVTVVGEGVETAEQLEALRECGCDLAQGYYLGRPMNAERTRTLLRNSQIRQPS